MDTASVDWVPEPLFAIQESFPEEKAPGHIPPLAALTAPSAQAAWRTQPAMEPPQVTVRLPVVHTMLPPPATPQRASGDQGWGPLGGVSETGNPGAPHSPTAESGSRGAPPQGSGAAPRLAAAHGTAACGPDLPAAVSTTEPQNSSLGGKDARPGPGASQWLLKPKDVREEDASPLSSEPPQQSELQERPGGDASAWENRRRGHMGCAPGGQQAPVPDSKSGTLKRYIRKGVPLEHRARVWMGVSGAQARMDRNPGYYQRLLQGERSTSLEEAIRTDMNRTFPDNVRFRKDAEPCLQGPLYNVLLAYGHHNHSVGYCQGMNFIAGYLILVTKSEEEAFWLLDALVGRILPADYYSPSMLGLKTDQEVLGELVRTKLPAVAALMHSHGVLWTLVASRWFICLFVDVLPVETVLRVWDCLFSEGSKIIFRVALTLLKHHQASILEATSVPDLCEKFKEITRGRFVTECHSFMQRIFLEPGSLSRASIARLREHCRARLLAQG
ncbi:hypothetical protein E5288_WYG011514 [Bos mutus]|uniref:Growth hormone-regulated TBC protein 1 n=1 Tax=Bos mutus TaxID=72004 RepID=A0A6B0RQN1_9CETA|nr:hypothetical protein [Bos mutus]